MYEDEKEKHSCVAESGEAKTQDVSKLGRRNSAHITMKKYSTQVMGAFLREITLAHACSPPHKHKRHAHAAEVCAIRCAFGK